MHHNQNGNQDENNLRRPEEWLFCHRFNLHRVWLAHGFTISCRMAWPLQRWA